MLIEEEALMGKRFILNYYRKNLSILMRYRIDVGTSSAECILEK